MAVHKFSWKTPYNPENLPTAAVIRYGAFGDTAQAASVTRALKRAGFHVTLFAQYPSSELVAKDPHIDELVVQLADQVPIGDLGPYWMWVQHKRRGKGFNHWVNLTESVEASLLSMPGQIRFQWAPKARHAVSNINYLEHMHNLARIPYEPWFEFYPTEDEIKWRTAEREKMRKAGIEKFIMWALAGSSRIHKVYPYAESIWQHVLKYYPTWGIVTAGDGSCTEFEKPVESAVRVWRTSGRWTMRQVVAMMMIADVVVGPETGLMSCAAFYSMPKVVILSHSTVTNLSRDWVNTTSLWAPKTECPGRGKNEVPACHLMLPSFENCRRNEQFGVAQCCVEIEPAWVWDAVQACMTTGVAPKWSPP